MMERLTENEMQLINGEIVTACDLAAARQQLAHDGALLPRWDELTSDEQQTSSIEAAGWLRALGRIAPVTRWYAGDLPTVEEIRSHAFGQVGDVLDTLRSDWQDGPTVDQAAALAEARRALEAAQAALDRAAR
jgi:hypothetical protein